jgi:ComF family protein
MRLGGEIKDGILDLVYPPFCLSCRRAGHYLCAECIEKIQFIEYPFCRVCGAPCEAARCVACKEREFAFESARSVAIFEGVLRDAIHAMKYDFHAAVAEPLGELMATRFPGSSLAGKVDLVIPVPIHRSRMLVRGFNQSEELARKLCRRVSLPLVTDVLYQPCKTKHQVNLSYDERASNMRGAFVVRDARKVAGKRVLVLDDVLTTGATANEAALALKNAGAKSVHAYTLARCV